MKKKERMQIDPVDMPQQDPKLRVLNVDEVPTGYTEEMAMLEAKRCIQCLHALALEQLAHYAAALLDPDASPLARSGPSSPNPPSGVTISVT